MVIDIPKNCRHLVGTIVEKIAIPRRCTAGKRYRVGMAYFSSLMQRQVLQAYLNDITIFPMEKVRSI